MSLYLIFGVLIVHWVADFILQTDEEAKGKSTSNSCLIAHTSTYVICWAPIGLLYCITNGINSLHLFAFLGITFVAHTVTDYFTSRYNKYLWEKGDTHNFFVSVGFDQVLHYVQLFLTIKLLT